jgi:hypothetical protein
VHVKSTPPVKADSEVIVIVLVPGLLADDVIAELLCAIVNVGCVTINCVADDVDVP